MNKAIAIISYLVSICFIAIGFNKMFVYQNSEYSFVSPKNAYVGGDAYNYIINSNYATAWFVLGVGLLIVGTLFLIKESIDKSNKRILNIEK